MWSRLGERLAQRFLVSAPALWGKLPSHGDYVRYRASVAQAHAWGEWAEHHWASIAPPPVPRASRRQRRDGPTPWVSTQAPSPQAGLHTLPVIFVLPPNSMPFAKRQFVQGVWLPSQDRSGRACPLVIYQLVHPRWLRRTTLADTAFGRHAGRSQHWLYWLSRLAIHVQGGANDFNRICQTLDELWALNAPGWGGLLGERPEAASSHAHHQALDELAALADSDASQGLRGVTQLPWPQWPEGLFRKDAPMAAFWQQDAQGGYINAATNLEELWQSWH